MKYEIYIERYAQRQIKKLDKTAIVQIKESIAKLAFNPRPFGYIKLKSENAYRIRVGNYRIIYEINDNAVTVIVTNIGHRKDIYSH